MIAMYKFQLAKLQKRSAYSGEISALGGSIKKNGKIVKSIYYGITSPNQISSVLKNKGEHFLGFITLQLVPAPGEQLIQMLRQDSSLSVIIVSEDKIQAFQWDDGKLKEETVRVEEQDFLALKQNGMLRQVDDGYYSFRLKVVAGQLSSQDLINISAVAEKFSAGNIHITSRQGIEIPFIHISDLSDVFQALEQKGLNVGATGPRVRGIIGCQGNFVCPNGLIDTTSLSNAIAERFFGRDLPHKFKIAVTGCPNNCIKADENDLGIKGAAKVSATEVCKHCGACAKVCPADAITVTNQEMCIDENKCVHCGKCAKTCVFQAIDVTYGYRLSFGGTFGRNLVIGRPVYPFVENEKEVLQIIEAALQFFKQYGLPKERLNKTIARVGWDNFEQYVKETC